MHIGENIKLTKQDENIIIDQFILSKEKKRSDKKIGNSVFLTDWITFRNTMIEWIT